VPARSVLASASNGGDLGRGAVPGCRLAAVVELTGKQKQHILETGLRPIPCALTNARHAARIRGVAACICPRNAELKKLKARCHGTLFAIFLSFWSVFFEYFHGVFELLMQRNGQKRDKKKPTEKRHAIFFFSALFLAKSC
jgi:hypothetical protein